jgi:hypothetical protein
MDNKQLYPLMDWALTLKPEDLPSAPWKLRSCVTTTDNEKFLTSLQRDIRKGPTSPRAKYGALQEDVIKIWNVINENE